MGAFHETLNLAALWHLPVVFLVVNNIYGMGTSVERASAEPELFRRAASYRIPGERIDGDDLEEVIRACSDALERARRDRTPSMIEALTYRYRGHSVADAGLNYRDKEEIAERQKGDPITRAHDRLRAAGAGHDELATVQAEARAEVDDAVEFALASPEPRLSDLAVGTYAPGSDQDFAAMRPGSPSGEIELVFEAGLGRQPVGVGA